MDAMREADLESVRKELEALNEKAKVETSFDPAAMIRDDVTKAVERPTDIGTSRSRSTRPSRRRHRTKRPPGSNRTWMTSAGNSKRSTKRPRPTPPTTWRRPPRRPRHRPGRTRRLRIRSACAEAERRANEPGGHRRHQGAVDGPSDRAAGAAHPVALRVLRGLPRLLLFLAHDLQHPDRALCAGGRGGEGDADRHPLPRAVLHQCPPQHVRGGRHRLSGHRHADLQVRRARPLQARAAGVSALSDRDAGLLPRRARCSSISS